MTQDNLKNQSEKIAMVTGANRGLVLETILWATTLPKGGPTGQFFADQAPIAW